MLGLVCGLLSLSLWGQDSLPTVLTSARWFNDEYSLDVKADGSYVMYFTFGDQSGEMRGGVSVIDDQTVLVPLGQIAGDFDISFFGQGLSLRLVNNPNDPKATLALVSDEENFTLWNKESFVPENQETTIDGVAAVTTGDKLSATTDNLRVRKGPGTNFDFKTFTYRDPQGDIKTFTSVLEGTNIRILARTKEKQQVQSWNNYWYYVEYKEPLGSRLVYRNAWCFGEFINQVATEGEMVAILSPQDEESMYNPYEVRIEGRVTGGPILLKAQIKNPFGNVIREKTLSFGADGSFTFVVSKDDEDLFIGSNIVHFQARYSGNKVAQSQVTFFVHESQGEKAKPVIYLYPKVTTDVVVKVSPAGGVTKSAPLYGDGWSVRAEPDGTLTDKKDGTTWNSLFWESQAETTYQGDEGFVVKTTDLPGFLDEKLAVLGLQGKEIDQLKDFWIPLLSQAPWYRIYFYDRATIDREAPLVVEPEPDSVIRVYFDPKPLAAPISIREQVLTPATRWGFAVVEWGGARY